MSVCGVKEYLRQWRPKTCGDATTTTTTNAAAPQLPRSFRPHRIVPRVFLGALGDVEDTLALRGRLLPERLLLVVSTCAKSGPPRLELRRVCVSAQRKSPPQLRLAVCSWERLEEIVSRSHSGEKAGGPQAMTTTAMWLKSALSSLSFDSDENSKTNMPQNGETNNTENKNENKVGVLYLKLSLPWKDEPAFPVKEHFEVATSLIRVVTCELEMAVVCHCVAGISRSATLICAFLLRCWCNYCGELANSHAASDVVREVVEFVREIRPCVCPNEGFTRQLIEYTKMLCSK